MAKFDWILIDTGSMDAWTNSFDNSAKDDIRNALQGKEITKANVTKALKSTLKYKYSGTFPRDVEYVGWFPKTGTATMKVVYSDKTKKRIHFSWDTAIAEETNKDERIEELEKRVAALEQEMMMLIKFVQK